MNRYWPKNSDSETVEAGNETAETVDETEGTGSRAEKVFSVLSAGLSFPIKTISIMEKNEKKYLPFTIHTTRT